MMSWLKAYFGFTKKELNGVLVLMLLIFASAMFPLIYSQTPESEVEDFPEFEAEVDRFYASEISSRKRYKGTSGTFEKPLPATYFNFDPNNLSEANWQKLGLTGKQIRGIKNYEAKGGKFFRKEDLKKMYTITPEKYRELEPYIVIKNTSNYPSRSTFGRAIKKEKPVIEVNVADSAELESLRGIGPAIAARIVKYRNRLGGFHAAEQLREVYGIDSLKFEELKGQIHVDNTKVSTININTVDFEGMKRHPYLTYKQMNAILQYRKHHGPYTSLDDLKEIKILNEVILSKIAPYLSF